MKRLWNNAMNLTFALVVAGGLGFGAWGAFAPLVAEDLFCYESVGCSGDNMCRLNCAPQHGGCVMVYGGGSGYDCFCECRMET